MSAWTETKVVRRLAHGDLELPRYERADHQWRVEETVFNTARPFYVMHDAGNGGHWACTAKFRGRFATAAAAMAAVDRKFPIALDR